MNHQIHAILSPIGNQAVKRLLQQAKPADLEARCSTKEVGCFAHDFSQIPVHAKSLESVQAKLTVGTPEDIYEQAADRVSEQVMRMPEPHLQHTCADGGGCPRCQTKQPGQEHERLQTGGIQSSDSGQITMPPIIHEALASPGQPLDVSTRDFMEPRFGHDFSQVRVHTDREAAESSRSLSAAAYTVGQNIVFGNKQYSPQTKAGQRLLAHELAHVVQQGAVGPRADSARNMPLSTHGDVHERPVGGMIAAREIRGSGVAMVQIALKSDVVGLMLQRQVIDPRTLKTKTVNTPRHLRVEEWLVEDLPGGGSAHTELYWVDFEVDSKGVMTASIRTVSPDRAFRSGQLRAGEQFRNALEHFEANGVEVNAFEGDWSYMTAEEVSENLRVFREELALGGTREAAALKTPSGKIATRSGFELTNVENVAESQPHLAEEGVRRWRVKAIFRRQLSPKAGQSGAGPGSPASEPGLSAGTLRTEEGIGEIAGAATKATRTEMMAGFLADALMVGPLDVLFLFIAFFGSLAEAREKLRQQSYNLGFSEGMAANLLGVPSNDALSMLETQISTPSIGERVAGVVGVRERASNAGVAEGYKFVGRLTWKQRGAFLKEGFGAIAARGHKVSRNFNRDDVIELAAAVKPIVDHLMEVAQEEELKRLYLDRRIEG